MRLKRQMVAGSKAFTQLQQSYNNYVVTTKLEKLHKTPACGHARSRYPVPGTRPSPYNPKLYKQDARTVAKAKRGRTEKQGANPCPRIPSRITLEIENFG